MKKIFIYLLPFVLFVGSASAYNNFWTEYKHNNVPTRGVNELKPSKFLVYQLHTQYITDELKKAPSNPGNGIIIELPAPDGSFVSYKVWEQTNMHPDLAAKYPEIKSYTGKRIDRKDAIVVLDIAPRGFHAMVLDGEQSYFIDPYSTVNDGFYLCYYKKDYGRVAGKNRNCGITDDAEDELKEGRVNLTNTGTPDIQFTTNGTDKKSYRLALACTGEYAKAVDPNGPSKPNVIAAMNTSLNRVNGVYRSELGIEMILIANNDILVFLDKNTDTFTSTMTGKMMGENHRYISDHIGSANFDIGHVFDAGAPSGQAELECVCNNNVKGRGVTGQVNPVGDAFDIDFVVHEFGHQFGARHTFNSHSSQCGGNNASVTAAYEPGSGSTIMGYAGICPPNDLQPNSDDYFHGFSQEQISNYVTVGMGATCDVVTNSGNTPASVPGISNTYFIPYLTPFELSEGNVTDNDHDALTYCWEQWDLGDFGADFAQANEGPIFRSFKGTSSNTRVFPRLDKIRQNVTNYLGEKLPTIERIMNFRLTVRDVLNGWGIFNTTNDEITLRVINTGTPFSVKEPNLSSAYWQVGSSVTVTWDIAGTNTAPINTQGVDIFLSLDDGQTYPYLLAQNVPNTGSAQVTVPNDAYTASARVKVKGAGNVFFDISNQSFVINEWPASVGAIASSSDIKVFPVPAEDVLNIQVNNSNHYQLSITNAIGQQVWSEEISADVKLNVGSWAAGIYSLQLTDKNSGERLVKQVVVH